MKKLSALAFVLAVGCGGGNKPATTTTNTTGDTAGGGGATTTTTTTEKQEPAAPPRAMVSKTPSELTWTPMDPNAGDKGPQTAVLWGDMATGPVGFFIKLPEGNPGVLHTHTSDYHAVGITGNTTNGQDGTKKPEALPTGSYWMQPANLAHTTACPKGGGDCVGYAFFTGKLDFAPAKAAKGAKPDPKYVEKRAKDLKWMYFDPQSQKGPQFANVWGDAQSEPNGLFIKIPAGSPAFYHVHSNDYHGVVLQGTVNNIESGSQPKDLPPGSYWMQPGGNSHTTNCKAGADCLVYVQFLGKFDFKPADK